jgi:hypothetical protein
MALLYSYIHHQYLTALNQVQSILILLRIMLLLHYISAKRDYSCLTTKDVPEDVLALGKAARILIAALQDCEELTFLI